PADKAPSLDDPGIGIGWLLPQAEAIQGSCHWLVPCRGTGMDYQRLGHRTTFWSQHGTIEQLRARPTKGRAPGEMQGSPRRTHEVPELTLMSQSATLGS